ncbi:hypothetical protein LX32DRAFT_155311 [Colletotrichum zoysiae]|uniref:Uncharacterized protein n=1 Tax=Colletotrichum zoysiae TaxID=1216348 RepID=A0AAD9HRS0_9PEZI|nr:hypothetical protein LX32DRAFT_155311 [Colletotrichum zoysiae]
MARFHEGALSVSIARLWRYGGLYTTLTSRSRDVTFCLFTLSFPALLPVLASSSSRTCRPSNARGCCFVKFPLRARVEK